MSTLAILVLQFLPSLFHFKPQLPKFNFKKTLSLSLSLFQQGFSICIPIPDALLFSSLNPDFAFSTATILPHYGHNGEPPPNFTMA